MGKKSKKQKKQKKRAKVASKVDRWVAEAQLSEEELIMAGLGVMAKAVEQGQKKLFNRAIKAGRRLADLGIPSLDTPGSQREEATPDAPTSSLSEPVISYQHNGGGWYSVKVAGIEVDRLQGEQPAAERAGELLAAYAGQDAADQKSRETGITHVGGGWYEVRVAGVPVDRVRGKDRVVERYGQLVS